YALTAAAEPVAPTKTGIRRPSRSQGLLEPDASGGACPGSERRRSDGPSLPDLGHGHLPKRPECGAQLLGEQLRLLPGSEVATLVDLVVIDQVGVRPLRPASWCLILLAGKDAHGHWNGDALGVEEATPIFPVEARRRDSGVCQPVERDVVE